MQQDRLYGTNIRHRILLDETQPPPKWHQVMKVGVFKHPKHGMLEITPEVLANMVINFNEKIRGVDIAWDYFHEFNGIASGWPVKLETRQNGTELWAETDWTPEAQRRLAEKELKYFSPDFAFEWEHPETGKVYKHVLFGGGLTNRPFLKDMKAIVANENTNEGVPGMKTQEELLKENGKLEQKVIKLNEDLGAAQTELADSNSELDNLKKENAELKLKLQEMTKSHETLMSEKKKADEAVKLAEKESEFNVLLSEGKAVVAQKEAYLKGDMKEYIKLAEKVNPKANGASGGNSSEDQGDDEDATIKLAEEIQTKQKVSYPEAMKQARQEIKNKAKK